MTTKTITAEILVCDMCGTQLTDLPYLPATWRSKSPHTVIEIDGHDWDFCEKCYDHIRSSLSFLTVEVGIDIEFAMKEGVLDESL
jgi:hypothetical protein